MPASSNLNPVFELRESQSMPGPSLVLTPPSLYKKKSQGTEGAALGPSLQADELQIYHKNFLWMENKHRALFVIKQSKWCKFMPKMQQNTFGGRTLQGPAGELMRSRDPVTAMGAYF